MSNVQMQNEIKYQLSKVMLSKKLITAKEYAQIDVLNRKRTNISKNDRCVSEKQASFAWTERKIR